MNAVSNENTATELYTSSEPGQNLEHMERMKVAMSNRAINGASRRNTKESDLTTGRCCTQAARNIRRNCGVYRTTNTAARKPRRELEAPRQMDDDMNLRASTLKISPVA